MSMFNKDITVARELFPRFDYHIVFQRFLKFFTIGSVDECWEWNGACGRIGYGVFNWREKKIQYAHIASYILFVGNIPKRHKNRLCVCHSCDNPKCVNPNHLWLGTQYQNMIDMAKKGRKAVTKGEDNGCAKLTSFQVNEIRSLYSKGTTQVNIAKGYGISQAQVSSIVCGRSWN